MKRFAAMTSALLLISGCATTSGLRLYPGETRPLNEVAQLVVAHEFEIKSVDGQKTSQGLFDSTSGTVLEMLPGSHEIVARFYSPFENGQEGSSSSYDKPDRSNFQTLQLEAAAGRRYAIARTAHDRQVVLSLVESGATTALGDRAATRVPERTSTTAAAEKRAEATHGDVPNITPLDNLKQWWHYATPQQRAEFRAWIQTAK